MELTGDDTQVLRHFGSGVIIATAFIHLLMHAFVMFNNECLGRLAYEAVAPAITMAAVMFIFMVDFLTARWASRRHNHTSPASSLPESADPKAGLEHTHDFSQLDLISQEGSSARMHRDVHFLEAGIVFHSIMVSNCF